MDTTDNQLHTATQGAFDYSKHTTHISTICRVPLNVGQAYCFLRGLQSRKLCVASWIADGQ